MGQHLALSLFDKGTYDYSLVSILIIDLSIFIYLFGTVHLDFGLKKKWHDFWMTFDANLSMCD